jgi:hypothetical protein
MTCSTARRSAPASEIGVAGCVGVVASESVVVLLPVVGLLGLLRLISDCGPPF